MQDNVDEADSSTSSDTLKRKSATGCASFFRYPKGVYFCLGNEFAERFSFYGMRAVLIFYLMSHHNFDESLAKLIFHFFVFVSYFTPLLGSILADGFFGRYKVILYVSILYCVGHVILTLGSLPIAGMDAVLQALDFLGLFTIAFSTGGIKPCVSAFAADQFPSSMVEERKQFFSFFYFSINIGALLSQILTPMLRGRVRCLGQTTCFPLAFGIPSLFMLMALVVFLCGTPFYKRSFVKDQVILNSVKCVLYAAKRKICGKKMPKPDHWLDHSVPRYGKVLVEDVKRVCSILILFLPVVVFWALFDQQGSTWVLQANRMNCRIGQLTLLPDQISLLNPLFIIILIPLFESFVYPFLTSHGMLTKSLQRMAVGGFLAAISFFIAAVLQWKINATMIVQPASGTVRLTVVNPHDFCTFHVGHEKFIGKFSTKDVDQNLLKNAHPMSLNCNSSEPTYSAIHIGFTSLNISNESVKSDTGLAVVLRYNGTVDTVPYPLEKTAEGNSTVYVILSRDASYSSTNRTVVTRNSHGSISEYSTPNNSRTAAVKLQAPIFGSDLFDLSRKTCEEANECEETTLISIKSETGAAVLLMDDGKNSTAYTVPLIPPNTVSVFWLLPQYILITVGELLFSVSGLEFSYSQASSSMKSVLQALWLLTVAFGNVLDMLISGTHLISNPAVEFLIYSILMAFVIGIFVILARKYKYVEVNPQSSVPQPIANGLKSELVPMTEKANKNHRTNGTFKKRLDSQ